MKRYYSLLILALFSSAAFAQSFVFPQFNKPVADLHKLLPPKWSIKDSARGDLSKDGHDDLALVLEYSDTIKEYRSDSMENVARPRVLLILLWDSVHANYQPICQNNTFIIRTGEGGMLDDAYGGITINKNVLSVSVEFLHETVEYKFRWQAGDLYLIGASDYGVTAATGETNGWEFNFSTKRAKHTWKKPLEKEHVEWKVIDRGVGVRLRDLPWIYSLKIFEGVAI